MESPRSPVEPIVRQILLRCPKCKRTALTDRQPTDYPEAVRVEVACPECNAGDFAETMQFDAAGRHITRDPDELPNAGLRRTGPTDDQNRDSLSPVSP